MGFPSHPFSGRQFLKACQAIGYCKVHQRGSHVKVRKEFPDGTNHAFSFPMHDELKLGLREYLIKTVEKNNPGVNFREILYGMLH